MVIVRKGDIEREHRDKQQDITNGVAQRNADLIEYLAMMTDVDIPGEEGNFNEQEV